MYRKFSVVGLVVLLVLLAVGTTQAQYDFEGCGKLVMDIEGGCYLFVPYTGGSYTLDDYGDFVDGDSVHVAGNFGTIGNPCGWCGTFQYPCIHNVSIVSISEAECPTVTGCCDIRVGDANCSGGDEPTIGDISYIIDRKFLLAHGLGWCCLEEADVNQSGGPDPTPGDITIGDISILIDYLFITGPTLGLNDCL